jgi:hypothetical protein
MTGPLLGLTLDGLRRNRASGENAGAVTLLGGLTTLLDVAAGADVAIGDEVLVEARINGTKGAAAGNTNINVVQTAGTATGVWVHDQAGAQDERWVGASQSVVVSLTALFRVTGAGTLTLRLQGFSGGSNTTVAIGEADLNLHTLRGSA